MAEPSPSNTNISTEARDSIRTPTPTNPTTTASLTPQSSSLIQRPGSATSASYSIRKISMGSSQSAIAKAIKSTLGNDSDLYAFPGDPLFKIRDAKPYNLDIQVRPAAVTYPKTKEQVAAIVKAAVQNGCKVQARCGGHSYANYCVSLSSSWASGSRGCMRGVTD